MERQLQVDYGRTFFLSWLLLTQLSRRTFPDLAHLPCTRNARPHWSLKERPGRREDIPAFHQYIGEWFNNLLLLPGMFVPRHLS